MPKPAPFTITALCGGVARSTTRIDLSGALSIADRWVDDDGCCDVRIIDPNGIERGRDACRTVLRRKYGLGPMAPVG